jgi:hypothetical protein
MAAVASQIRAVVLGLLSGIDDVVLKKDNSWWASFGGMPQAVIWVQLWLCLLMLVMFAAMVTALVQAIVIIMHPHSDAADRQHVGGKSMTALEANVFGLVLAFINFCVLWEPTWCAAAARPARCFSPLRLPRDVVSPLRSAHISPLVRSRYVMRGRKIKVSLRHTEVLMLIFIGAVVIFSTAITNQPDIGGILSHH